MRRIWIGVSVLSLLGAGLAALFGKLDATFVLATLGAVGWFLSYRAELVRNLRDTNLDKETPTSSDENDYD